MAEVENPVGSSSGLLNKEFLDQCVQVYTTSVNTTLQIQKRCRAITDFLESKGIDHIKIDMCMDLEARPRMLEIIPDEFKEDEDNKHLPPQVFAGDFEYCGSFDEFMEAKELDKIYTFFRLTPPEGSAEHRAAFPEPSEVSVEEIQSEPEEDAQSEVNPEENQEEQNEEEEKDQPSEQKTYDPEVSMDGGNIQESEMFAAAMGEQIQEQQTEQTQKINIEEQEDGEVIELSVQASQRDEEEELQEVASESGQQSVIDKNEMMEQEAE